MFQQPKVYGHVGVPGTRTVDQKQKDKNRAMKKALRQQRRRLRAVSKDKSGNRRK